jgi:FAD/FMN-containing dehydrogenase
MTLTAECGVTIAALRAALAARSQELPLEGGFADRATLGGVLAANASGPRRLRFGAPFDRILGARVALGDGTLARSGGRVVKNVAGYAIHRLLCGSRGGLAVLIEASLKLAPAPERRVMLELDGLEAAALSDPARWTRFPRLEPAGLTVTGHGDGTCTVSVGFEDEPRWVESQAAATLEAIGAPSRRLEDAEVCARWQALADAAAGEGPALELVTPGNTPAALGPLLAKAPRARFVFHAPAGRLHLFAGPTGAQELVDALAEHEFTLVAACGLDVAPTLPPQVALRDLRQRIRAALDPGSTFALGERWGWGRFC